MRGLLLLALAAVMAAAVQDFHCLKLCAAQNRNIVQMNKKRKTHKVPQLNCLKKCDLTNKVAFAKKITDKKVLAKKKALLKKKGKKAIKHITHVVGTPGKQHLTPLQKQELALKKEVAQDELERRKLEQEMRQDELEVRKHRQKASQAKHQIEDEDRELADELRKVANERAKMLAITHKEMKAKLQEELDEHGQKLGKSVTLKKWKAAKATPTAQFACMHGCLLAIHNVPVCRKRCHPKKKLSPKKKKAFIAKKKVKEAKALKKGCGPCYGSKKKGQCCNTCAEVKKAYAAKRWALPPLSRMVQCKAEAAKEAKMRKNAHARIFRSSTGKMQHSVNKDIHKLLFHKMKRNTKTKGHFKPKTFKKKSKSHVGRKALRAKQRRIKATIRKWKKYHKKRFAGKHPKVSAAFFKHLKSVVRRGAPVMKQGAMMLKMNKVNLKKWQMMKIHQWTSKAHKATIKLKVKAAKKAALKTAKKHPEVKKKKPAHPKKVSHANKKKPVRR